MLSGLVDPLRALAFTAGGAGLAWLWTSVHPVVALSAVAAIFLLSFGLAGYGRGLVGRSDEHAMWLMETRVVSIGVLTAAAGALGIIITVELATDAKGYEGELATVVGGALVAFFAGITYTAEKVDEAVGSYIASAFQSVYVRQGQKSKPDQVELVVGSDAHLAVMSSTAFGLTDWSAKNRRKRLDYLTGKIGNGGRIAAGAGPDTE